MRIQFPNRGRIGVFVAAAVALLAAAVSAIPPTSSAQPPGIEIVATGTLEVEFGIDEWDLDGATVQITYTAPDATVGPDEVFVQEGRAAAVFDVFSMTVGITNRPNGAPDVSGLTTTNDPIIVNNYPPSSEEDHIAFDSRSFDGTTETPWHSLHFGALFASLDGTQDAIDGEAPATSLEVLHAFGPSLSALPGHDSIRVEVDFDGQFRMTDLVIEHRSVAPLCNGRQATIWGTKGADKLTGTANRDVIVGLGGNDVIEGRGGNDLICGGYGNDRISGNNGNDTIWGNNGKDQLRTGNGNDRAFGGYGNDLIIGGRGTDRISGNNGDDTIVGAAQADTINGGDGRDTLRGKTGADTINGGPGNDRLNGGAHRDHCNGQRGTDTAIRCEFKTGIP